MRLRRDARDHIHGCFTVAGAVLVPGRRRLVAGGLVRLLIRCLGHQRCRGTVDLRPDRPNARPLATARFHVPPGRSHPIALRLNARAVQLRATCGLARIVVSTLSPFTPGQERRTSNRRDLGTTPHSPARCRRRR
ncbi:MAG TPA: hypothetical protein VH834_13125 [Solirubrobacteraceae bacterium]